MKRAMGEAWLDLVQPTLEVPHQIVGFGVLPHQRAHLDSRGHHFKLIVQSW